MCAQALWIVYGPLALMPYNVPAYRIENDAAALVGLEKTAHGADVDVNALGGPWDLAHRGMSPSNHELSSKVLTQDTYI